MPFRPFACLRAVTTCLVFACIWATLLEARANLILGNLPPGGAGYGISTESGNTFGAAVEFTPLSDVSFDNVTLWLSGYNGLDGSSLSLSLMNDNSVYGFPSKEPAATLATGSATPNDGSDAAFTFALSGQLQANTPYWLFLYLQVPGGGFGPNNGRFNCHWDGGGDTVGNVIIDGSEAFANDFLPSSFQTQAPAFALNTVPDHGATALLLALAIGCCMLFVRRYRSQN